MANLPYDEPNWFHEKNVMTKEQVENFLAVCPQTAKFVDIIPKSENTRLNKYNHFKEFIIKGCSD